MPGLMMPGASSQEEFDDLRGPFGINWTGNRDSWIDPGEDPRDYEDKQRDLLAGEWSRYKDIYRPLEDYLFERLDNWDEITAGSQQSAMQTANRQFTLGRQQQERSLRGYGLTLNQDQRKSLDRQYDMAAATSAINAANTTGAQMDDLRYGLIGGASSYQPNMLGRGK